MIDFEPTDEQRWIVDTVRQFATNELRPRARECDESGKLPTEPGYSRKLRVEKWMRDAKINDIYEGTQQINQLIVARRILDYPSSVLR